MTLNRGRLENDVGFWERLSCIGMGAAQGNAMKLAQAEGRNVY